MIRGARERVCILVKRFFEIFRSFWTCQVFLWEVKLERSLQSPVINRICVSQPSLGGRGQWNNPFLLRVQCWVLVVNWGVILRILLTVVSLLSTHHHWERERESAAVEQWPSSQSPPSCDRTLEILLTDQPDIRDILNHLHQLEERAEEGHTQSLSDSAPLAAPLPDWLTEAAPDLLPSVVCSEYWQLGNRLDSLQLCCPAPSSGQD